MKAIILAGGLGTRLRSITGDDLPKCMVRVMDKPIVDYVVRRMRKQGITDITLSLHYKAEKFLEFYGDDELSIVKCTIEERPLGTGGAIKNCITSPDIVLVCNGDTIAPIDYEDMARHYEYPLTIARTPDGKSAGIYILNPDIFHEFPQPIFSFENELIPKVHHNFYEIPWFTDIGTPETYKAVHTHAE